jgi:hypothetical protein
VDRWVPRLHPLWSSVPLPHGWSSALVERKGLPLKIVRLAWKSTVTGIPPYVTFGAERHFRRRQRLINL